jgi:hypothetical protein
MISSEFNIKKSPQTNFSNNNYKNSSLKNRSELSG